MPVIVAALLTALARAADPADPVVVAWQVAEGCPGVDALHAGIRRSLGGLAVERRVPVRVGVVVVREAPQRFRLELQLDAGDGPSERVLTSDTCGAAVDTAAWLIAVAIDVRATDPAAPPSPEITVPEPPPGPTRPAFPRARAPRSRARHRPTCPLAPNRPRSPPRSPRRPRKAP
ncbi:hypothetical protein [Nannocystis pusilla]|uniref:hypothetical protein n=1 Tax=Nannocystis pusilla TaxID=889268 RepID=UPI003B826EDF